jgi:hypothetical protein
MKEKQMDDISLKIRLRADRDLIEEFIIKNIAGIKIDFIQPSHQEGYWRYEVACRVKVSPEQYVGSLLCTSVSGTVRQEAFERLVKALMKDHKELQLFVEEQ